MIPLCVCVFYFTKDAYQHYYVHSFYRFLSPNSAASTENDKMVKANFCHSNDVIKNDGNSRCVIKNETRTIESTDTG